jgi:enterochelin esterase-like enzyme
METIQGVHDAHQVAFPNGTVGTHVACCSFSLTQTQNVFAWMKQTGLYPAPLIFCKDRLAAGTFVFNEVSLQGISYFVIHSRQAAPAVVTVVHDEPVQIKTVQLPRNSPAKV